MSTLRERCDKSLTMGRKASSIGIAVRPAIATIDQMPWHELDEQWQYFLDEDRYPIGRPMDLRPDEVRIFSNLVQRLLDQTREPMRILMLMHGEEDFLNNISVVVDSYDLETLRNALEHIRMTAAEMSIDGAITVSSIQPGSMEIFLTSDSSATKFAMSLAILLARRWLNPLLQRTVELMTNLVERMGHDKDEEKAKSAVFDRERNEFWEEWAKPLEERDRGNERKHPRV